MGEARFAIVIPVYNPPPGVAERVIEQARATGYPVFAVDDGSTSESASVLDGIQGITLLRHPKNCGKGAALRTGLAAATQVADWAISIDADGQHDVEEARRLVAAIPAGQRPIVIGWRSGMDGPNTPWTSRYGRAFSNLWIWVAGGHLVHDSQSGFRIYPLPETLQLAPRSRRFQFEIEVLVLARWKRVPVLEVSVSVHYDPPGVRVSHFRPFIDFLRNTLTFTRLIIYRCIIPPSIRTRLAKHEDAIE